MSWLHEVTHRHLRAYKEGVGRAHGCFPRLPVKGRVFFQPDLSGADWHELHDPKLVEMLMSANSAHEAMAILRKSQ